VPKRRWLCVGDAPLDFGSKPGIKKTAPVKDAFLKQLSHPAMRDGLTQVYNKRLFQHVIQTEFAYHSRQKQSLSVLMLATSSPACRGLSSSSKRSLSHP